MMKRLNLALALSAILGSALWADDATEKNEGSAVFGRPKGAINTKTLDLGDGVPPLTMESYEEYVSGKKPYDLVLANGHIMDPETQFDAVANIGIVGNRIIRISTDPLKGKETIDVKGLVVAPGFVDTHTHGMDPFSTRLYIRDGVTSAMDLEYGTLQVDKFYDSRKGTQLINYGTAVSHEYARMAVLDRIFPDESTNMYPWRTKAGEDGESSWAEVLPDEKQLEEIYAWMRRGLDHGAVTACSTVGYFGKACTLKEVYEIQRIAWEEYGRGYSSHTRMLPHDPPPMEYHLGIKEAMANAAVLGSPLLVSHNNNNGWQEINEMCKKARERGMLWWDEQYPYAAGGPNVGAPPLALENLKKWGMTPEENLQDPSTGEFYTTEKFLEDRKNNPSKSIIWFARPPEWVNQFIATPEMVIVSDALPMFDENGEWLPIDFPFEKWEGHPRVPGTRGKCLRIAREEGIPLMRVINNAGAFNAKMLRKSGVKFFDKRGSVQEGWIADLTLFDPKTVTDNSDYTVGKNGLPTTGIPYVIVSGKVAMRDSKVDLDVRAGQPIRHRPIERK